MKDDDKPFQRRYADGSLYASLKKEGKQEYYDPAGDLRTEFSLAKGRIHGHVRLFYPGGATKRDMELDHGKIVRDTIYDEDGKILHSFPPTQE